jgi:hypothetical protein
VDPSSFASAASAMTVVSIAALEGVHAPISVRTESMLVGQLELRMAP